MITGNRVLFEMIINNYICLNNIENCIKLIKIEILLNIGINNNTCVSIGTKNLKHLQCTITC